jgi:hypothetical protein
MANSRLFTRDQFIECKWRYDVLVEEHYGYFSVTKKLQEVAKAKLEAGEEEQAKIFKLLGRATLMMLVPDSINEPFKAYIQDFQADKRSDLPEDFTTDELAFFEDIIYDIDEAWLKARLADLLWLCKKPKNPNHAKLAIESYIFHTIDPDTWQHGINDCWERAARLSIQIKDFDKINKIKNQLFAALGIEYSTSKFMSFWVASLLDKLKIDQDYIENIASTLSRIGKELMGKNDFYSARPYFELSAKKYLQSNNERGWLENVVSIADCFMQEADSRFEGGNMAANSFYEKAIQIYRRIPAKHRNVYDVDNKIKGIRAKITDSGQVLFDEMRLVQTPGVDISHMIEISIAHVSAKNSIEEALGYFTGLYSGPEYDELAASAKENIKKSFFSSLFGSMHINGDGRVVAKTPPMNLNADYNDLANQAVLHRQIQQQFAIDVQLAVESQILPALSQLLMEHRFTKEFMVDVCHHSPLVPQDRKYLLGHALWLGFEHDFGNAIHLLCPQLEHMVRIRLKEAKALTSNIDREGIENENGLSTLMDLPEATQIFGENLVFEIKSIFTDALGFNLRNEVAHGLLDDNSSITFSTIYAWWMILRLIIHSIISGNDLKN